MDTRVCENCGKPYKPVKGNQKYCPVCKNRHAPIRHEQTLVCPICKKEFISDIYNRKYCSPLCRGKAARLDVLTYDKVCEECGKAFKATKISKKYCCKDCAKKAKVKKDMQWRHKDETTIWG